MANTLRKEGINIKEYPTLTSMFKRITTGAGEFPKPIYLEPKVKKIPVSNLKIEELASDLMPHFTPAEVVIEKREVMQTPIYPMQEEVRIPARSIENVKIGGQSLSPVKSFDQVVKDIVGVSRVVNPKRIVSSKPVPTLDQLRVRRGY